MPILRVLLQKITVEGIVVASHVRSSDPSRDPEKMPSLLNLAKLSALLPLDNPPTWWLSHDYVRSYACCVLARRWSCGILAKIPTVKCSPLADTYKPVCKSTGTCTLRDVRERPMQQT